MSHASRRRRRTIDWLEDELYDFLRQRNISAKNIAHAELLAQHADERIRELAKLVVGIARVKPHRRRRMGFLASRKWELFVRMVRVLDDEFWDECLRSHGGAGEWLWDAWERASVEARYPVCGKVPCWCGSGLGYWDCCAQRDEEYAAQFAEEQRVRESERDPENIPWWHPRSGIDHFTRCAYEMYYADPNHPLAIPAPECREEHAASGSVKREWQGRNEVCGERRTSNIELRTCEGKSRVRRVTTGT